ALGDRLKMLRAIRELSGAVLASPQHAFTEPKTQDAAERRQVTVMFSDLVGSTALSARMEPEDLREVISAYQKCVAEAVRRFGGLVAKYLGDGVLVYFGYPQAHEDDAERAVRAGLELIGGGRAQDARFNSNPCRHCDRARCRRRDAESLRAPAGNRRAEHGRHRLRHTKTSRQSVRVAGPRGQGPQGHWWAGTSLGGAAAEFGGEPLRGAAPERPDRARRAQRRIQIAFA